VTFGSLTRRVVLQRGLVLASSLVAGGLLAGCEATKSETAPPKRIYKVVFLFTRLAELAVQNQIGTVRTTLTERGYVGGSDIMYDGRSAESITERFPALAVEVVNLHPDVIVCQNVLAAVALKKETTTIPVVFAAMNADPVKEGLVASIAKPGGNVTGISSFVAATVAKRLQLLKEVAPRVVRVAVIEDKNALPTSVNELRSAAPALGMEVLPFYISGVGELDRALGDAVDARVDALVNLASFVTGTQTSGPKLAEFAIQHGWPNWGIATDAGGLMNYLTAPQVDPWRLAGEYVARILRGERPADMPVELSARSILTINLCTAQKLGLTVPQSMLTSADALIPCPRP
jgi:putative ABC transport system substrate-binding protein